MIFKQTILQITHINQLPVAEIYSIPPTTTMGRQNAIQPGRNGQK